TSSRSLVSFASVSAISAESARFDFAPATASELFGFAAGGAAASRKPPVTAAVATRNAALIFDLVAQMAFDTPSSQRGLFSLEVPCYRILQRIPIDQTAHSMLHALEHADTPNSTPRSV